MDTRTTSADFYPGGKTPVTAGGGITSGETGGAAGEPMVPVTKVEQLPEHYRESDMRSKINELARVISGGVAAIIAMVSMTLGAEPVKVLGAKKDALWNDDFVVTNVVADFAGFATTNTVTGATNALAATFVRGLEVATNAVLQAGAKEIAAATNALSQSVDERLKASTNGSFSASSLEPYAKRTWVEAQGYLKSTNLTGYAQVNWVQNQGFIKKENASGDIARIVNEKIAAQDKTAAYRLMTADGTEWIDGTGVWWKVTGVMEVDGLRLSGSPDAMNWNDDKSECECWIEEQGEDGYLWSYIKAIRVVSDDGYENETRHQYTVLADRKTGTMEAKIEESDNFEMANGSLPPETLTMRHWIATNTVTRLATTNDMPKIDFSKIPTLTTNDVCAIVTNEVASGWICEMKELGHLFEYRDPPDFYPGDEVWSLWLWTDGGADKIDFYCVAPEDATELNFTPWLTLRRTSGNALGLAMVKDLEKLPTHETVTNVARAVSNSFWDDKNEVLWRLEFRDGEPMFVPITNENVKATGGVL